jgi:streptogramin lyase
MRGTAVASLVGSLLFVALTGCGVGVTAPSVADTGAAIRGVVHGGQQPVSGAHIYLYAANTTGYGGYGITASSANASVSLLKSSVLTNNAGSAGVDSSGNYYVVTDAHGGFTVSSDYSCTAGQQVYLYAIGGNPGAGTNSAAAFLAILGACPSAGSFAAGTNVFMNEVTTAAAAYAFAGFATDATHVSSSATTLAATGIANAFATATNLVTLSTGTALAAPASPAMGTAPQATLNTVANILAACVNASDASPANCTTLFENATSNGVATTSTGGGTNPTDTATAAINLVHSPAANVAALYGLQAGVAAPFLPDVSPQPASFTATLVFTSTAYFNEPYALAVDGSGDVWVSQYGNENVAELSPAGAVLGDYAPGGSAVSGVMELAVDTAGNVWATHVTNTPTVYELNSSQGLIGNYAPAGSNLNSPLFLAFDASSNVWIADGDSGITELNSAGGLVGFYLPAGNTNLLEYGIAIDTAGNAWATNALNNTVTELNSSGTLVGTYAPANSNLKGPGTIAIDGTGNPWVTNVGGNSVTELNSTGGLVGTYAPTGSNFNNPEGLAIDGGGNVWVTNESGTGVTELNSAGAFAGYFSGTVQPFLIAVDGSGNVWWTSLDGNTMTELIGAAVPTVTPIAANLRAPYGAHAVNRP